MAARARAAQEKLRGVRSMWAKARRREVVHKRPLAAQREGKVRVDGTRDHRRSHISSFLCPHTGGRPLQFGRNVTTAYASATQGTEVSGAAPQPTWVSVAGRRTIEGSSFLRFRFSERNAFGRFEAGLRG